MRFAPLFALLLAGASARAQAVPDTLQAPTDSLNRFGWTVDSDDEWLLVGADEIRPSGGLLSDPKGTAFVYRIGDGVPSLSGRLVSDRIGNEDCFSWSMDVRDDVAVVGARCENADRGSGAAYVYRYDGTSWVREAKLRTSDLVGVDGPVYAFGGSVALGEGYLVVGAMHTPNPNSPTDDFWSGAAFVFERQSGGWVHTATLVNGDADEQSNETFGASVAVDGESADAIVVGAYQGLGPGATSRRGAVYVFERHDGGWVERARLLEPSESRNTDFGEYLAAGSGGVAVFSHEAIYPLNRSEVWSVGEALTPPGFDPCEGARWGPTVVAVGATVGVQYPVHIYTEASGAWSGGARFTLDYYQSVAVSVNSRDLFVARAYGGSQTPDRVLVYRLAAFTDVAPAPPPAPGLDVALVPNPTSGPVRIRFETEATSPARLTVVDALGRRVAERALGALAAGPHEVSVDLGRMAPGVYVVRVEAGGETATRLLVRR